LRQPPFLIQGSHDGFERPFYVFPLPGLGGGHQRFPGLQPVGTPQKPRGKSAISACWASRSLTIFRNGPLFGVMTNVKCVSQSAIVRLDLRRQALTVRCNNCCACRTRCVFFV
jgi:hypothetical protein